ncbi:hypothetical protein [Neobacillus niacini]|uniref:hypothetical protein n=1 Tax=Neobacillus niacini TaxID=86668 RepID=UPI0005EEA63A|nr:hypothetical protein [Neobacillus niacini]
MFSIPTLLIVAGIAVISIFIWEMKKETALLAKSVVKPYEPELHNRTFKEEAWIKLPEPGSQLGDLPQRYIVYTKLKTNPLDS